MCLIGRCIEHFSVTESSANIDADSERGQLSCLLCLQKKDVSAFANSPSYLRKHVEVRTVH